MKKLTLLLLFLSFCFVGCTTAYLYPVQGPIAKADPTATVKAKVSGILGNSGDMSLTLPSGEIMKGRWSVIAPMSVGYTHASANATATNGMNQAWVSAYGNSVTIRNQQGVNRGEAYLTGKMGTTMQVEFYVGSGTASGTGVALDSNQNIYKVLF